MAWLVWLSAAYSLLKRTIFCSAALRSLTSRAMAWTAGLPSNTK